jgi:hypothetical protein
MLGALSDERTGLSFTIAAGPRQRSHSQVRVIFYYLRFKTSLFVFSYDSHGYGGGTWPRLHTGLTQRSHVSSLNNFGKDRIEITASKSSFIIMCLSVAAETCLVSRWLATEI